MKFAERLKTLMDANKTSSYKLAKAVGCTVTSVTNWLSGKEPRPSYIQKIATFFGVSVDYLLGAEQEKTPTDSGELDKQLDGIDFALYGEVKELTDAQKRDVLKFVKFIKQGDE